MQKKTCSTRNWFVVYNYFISYYLVLSSLHCIGKANNKWRNWVDIMCPLYWIHIYPITHDASH